MLYDLSCFVLTIRRKHTGERPFQCHCNRRFSRLDNLRQHAQTVHVNEEIPGDSLAATGTRFQRQIRTDRVRPAGARSRASTTSSQTSHGRGHARNLSTSSIASTASNVSTISSMSQDPRQYPQPLMMAPEHRHSGGLTIDTMRASPGFTYSQHSSGGPSTPTSTHYSQGPASPFGSTMGSPISASRFSASHYENRGGRRLSVPNGASPFQNGPGPQFVTPMSPSSAFASSNTSALNSPTSSVFSNRLETSHGEPELKRRTWHPSTYNSGWHQRPATSGLSYSQTPDAPRPAFSGQPPPAASQPVRLPGFGDLMQTIHRPATPPGQIAQPVTESPSRPPLMSAGGSSDRSVFNERPGHRSLDMSIYQNLNKLDIASGTPPRENASWGQQIHSDPTHAVPTTQTPPTHPQFVQIQAQPTAPGQQPLAPAPAPPAAHAAPQGMANAPSQPQSLGIEPDQHATAGTRNRRQGWYKGPIAPAPQVITTAQQHRVSPASSSSEGVPTPSDPSFQHHPTIVHTNSFGDASSGHPSASSATAYPHAYPATSTTGQGAEGIPNESVADYNSKPLTGLDALVAAATSESRAREAAVQR